MVDSKESSAKRRHGLIWVTAGSTSVYLVAHVPEMLALPDPTAIAMASGEADDAFLALLAFLIGTLFVIHSSEMARRASALRETVAEERVKGEFLANMGHELRTPLNGVLGAAQILAKDTRPPSEMELVTTITRSGEHLLALVNDLIDYASPLPPHLQPTTCSTLDILQEVHSAWLGAATQKGLVLLLDADPTIPPIQADDRRLRQVLLNLVSNAVKFTAAGRVVVNARRGAGNLEFTVTDTGPGIAPERLPTLLTPVLGRGGEGPGKVGIGLVVCARIAQAMNGTLRIESVPGQGTTAHFSVPFVEATAPGPVAHSAGLRVLVVDDNVVNQKVLLNLLRRLGLQADVAADGQQALDAATGTPYDLILMDLMMPVMDGLEATRRILALPTQVKPRIVAVTASGGAPGPDACLAAGMSDFVNKPLRLEAVAEVLRKTPVTTQASSSGADPERLPPAHG